MAVLGRSLSIQILKWQNLVEIILTTEETLKQASEVLSLFIYCATIAAHAFIRTDTPYCPNYPRTRSYCSTGLRAVLKSQSSGAIPCPVYRRRNYFVYCSVPERAHGRNGRNPKCFGGRTPVEQNEKHLIVSSTDLLACINELNCLK